MEWFSLCHMLCKCVKKDIAVLKHGRLTVGLCWRDVLLSGVVLQTCCTSSWSSPFNHAFIHSVTALWKCRKHLWWCVACVWTANWYGIAFTITATQRTEWFSYWPRMFVRGPALCTSGTSWSQEWSLWSTTTQTTARSVGTGTTLRSRRRGRRAHCEKSTPRLSLGKGIVACKYLIDWCIL